MSRKMFVATVLCVALGAAGWAVGQRPAATTTADEQAIRQSVAAYAAAVNKADMAAIAAHWATDAEYIDEGGTVHRGRDTVTALFRKFLAEQKGIKMALTVKSLRFLRPEVAMGDGTSDLTLPNGSVDKGRFSAVWVKSDGKWLLASARDLPAEGEAASPLQEFQWLVGDWQAQDKDGMTMSCHPTLGKAFLHLTFAVKYADGEMSVLILLGFDPLTGQLKAWTFDSMGGYGETLWSRDGNQWTGLSVGVLPDGQDGSSTHVLKFVDDQTFILAMRDRRAAGQPLADSEVKYVRKAAPR